MNCFFHFLSSDVEHPESLGYWRVTQEESIISLFIKLSQVVPVIVNVNRTLKHMEVADIKRSSSEHIIGSLLMPFHYDGSFHYHFSTSLPHYIEVFHLPNKRHNADSYITLFLEVQTGQRRKSIDKVVFCKVVDVFEVEVRQSLMLEPVYTWRGFGKKIGIAFLVERRNIYAIDILSP
ncbi:hypothetical protein Tco_0023083 [Tanacetum coccineum]